jgi:DNA-binding ferritin-like protein
MASKLLSALLHSRTQAHVYHWRTKSFAAHKALQNYYEAIVPLFDEYAEGYQGRYGLVSGYTSAPLNQNPMKARVYFQKLLKKIDETKIRDTYLKNILDTIRQLVYQTMYLLTLDQNRNRRNSPKSINRK